jgi:hypothetical protein
MAPGSKKHVALTVRGDRNETRLTFPTVLDDGALERLAEIVRRKDPARVYYLVEMRGPRHIQKGDTLYVWHVGDGFAHEDGWWVDAMEQNAARKGAPRFSRHNQPITCRSCGKRTTQEVQGTTTELCARCLRESDLENEHNDEHFQGPVAGCPWCEKAQKGSTPNGGYYVWVLGSHNEPLEEGPAGPHELESAKTFARISATKGAHDRVVSRGRNPEAPSFEIVRRYRAGTGERTV